MNTNKIKMKKYRFLAIALLMGSFANGQTLADAIKKTENERYELAGKDYRTLIANDANQADNYFYYGENFFKSDDIDSAKIIWKKGFEIDANNPLALVGIGKVYWLDNDTITAKQKFETALSSTKNKNAEVMRQIAAVYTYSPVKSLENAINLLNNSIKIDAKNVDGYLMLGDAWIELGPKNATEAMKHYNKALDLSKSSKVIVRKAKVYQRAQNYQLANDMYKEAQELDPTYAPAYRENAELNMLFDQSKIAIENWKKYLNLNDSDHARYRYATSLYKAKQYCEAVEEFETLKKNHFENMYTARLDAYSLYECALKAETQDPSRYQQSLASIDRLFQIAPKDKIIGLDHKYRGMILNKLERKEDAVKEYNLAVENDTTLRKEVMGELAKQYMADKNYEEAIKAYNAKLGSDSSSLSATDYFELGRAYFFGPKDYSLSDKANERVAQLAPTFALAPFWRARANVQLDIKKQTWAAQPFYQEFLDKLTPEEQDGAYKPFVIEANKYLGDYYVNSPAKDSAKAKQVWARILELDPTDKQAKIFFGK